MKSFLKDEYDEDKCWADESGHNWCLTHIVGIKADQMNSGHIAITKIRQLIV